MSRLTTALLPLILMVTLVCTSTATAKEFNDVNLPDQYELAGQSLQLNGQGMRKKFFFSIYVGALYTPTKVTSSAEVMKPEMPKVIRMHYVYDEISAEKQRNGYAESIDNNIPDFSKTAEAQKFLQIFNFTVVKDDTVDMQFTADGTLTIIHNGKKAGQVTSAAVSKAVLSMYFGPEPIESLNEGMLGD